MRRFVQYEAKHDIIGNLYLITINQRQCSRR